MKNVKIKNTYIGSGVTPVGIFIYEGNQSINLHNIKVISGNITNGKTIYFVGGTGTFYIKNYGLFVNNEIDSNVDLLIGIKNEMDPDYNYLYIEDSDL
ncbi:MAG: hypothetical protein IPM96_13600 [Ignavibacteria bacterium]|nr:hypothetical protein [Ignavibacteria bacterium]